MSPLVGCPGPGEGERKLKLSGGLMPVPSRLSVPSIVA